MRKRREMAAGADGAFFRNDRIDPPVEHFTKQLDDLATHSAQAEREDIRAQQHHRAHLRLRQPISSSTRVATHKVQLKLKQFVAPNPNVSELTKSGVDSVNYCVPLDDLFDQFARCKDARTREISNVNGLASAGDRCKLNKRNLLAIQLHSRSLARIVEALKPVQLCARQARWRAQSTQAKKARSNHDLDLCAKPHTTNCLNAEL